MSYKFALGDKVKDRITGYAGVIICRSEWLYGCIRYVLQAKRIKDGKITPTHVTDEGALDLVEANSLAVPHVEATGGPRDDPARGHEIER